MISIVLKSQKRTVEAEIPTCWEDISLTKYYALIDWLSACEVPPSTKDIVNRYSILTGVDSEIISKSIAYTVKSVIDEATSFIQTENGNLEKRKLPKFVEYKGDLVKVPSDLKNVKEFGQLIGFENEMRSIVEMDITEGKKGLRRDATIIAYFMYQELTGEEFFDGSKVDDLITEIEQWPVTVAFPIAVFFWTKLNKSRSKGVNGYIESQRTQNAWQRLRCWIGRVISQPSTTLPEETLPNT